ncbi:MAG: ATP synthase F1 subunit gamma [bacterium]|nr:ATP synthase F1 subunit gamma [bacterium]
MAVVVKTIKTRLKSVKNIRKITKTMEMVSGAKMRKAVKEVLLSKEYAKQAWQMISNISQKTDSSYHSLLRQPKETKKVAIILFSGNKGLCGGFNSQIVAKAIEFVESQKKLLGDFQEDWIVVGKKGAVYLARKNKNIAYFFEKPELANKMADVLPIANIVIDGFGKDLYQKVFMAYTDYISVLKQKPQAKILLPLGSVEEVFEKDFNQDFGTPAPPSSKQAEEWGEEYLFEPKQSEILDYFLPHLVSFQIYQALLESNGSEHSARMNAMRNASETTMEMIDGLNLVYNQARQAGITREIAEIAGAKAALE